MRAVQFKTYDDLMGAYEAQDGRAGYFYEKEPNLRFWVLLPTGVMSRLNIGAGGWQMAKHADGTVSITPSIWNQSPPGEWHGWLTRDEFVSC